MKQLFVFLFFMSVIVGCKTYYRTTQITHHQYRIQDTGPKDSSLQQLLSPYADSVNKHMNVVIGMVANSLEKGQPESNLGNLMADAMLLKAAEKFNTTVDAAFINYGGIRLNQITPGALTKGKVYELMPFDNLIVLQTLSGSELKQMLDVVAGRGGWPVAGIRFTISQKKATDITIKGVPLDLQKKYTIANSDFVANGGDDISVLKGKPQQNIGYLLRDALIEYFSSFQQEGKNISVHLDNRVTHAQ